jgi:hypothetical protein
MRTLQELRDQIDEMIRLYGSDQVFAVVIDENLPDDAELEAGDILDPMDLVRFGAEVHLVVGLRD